jgi:hypothetical protein
VCSAPGLHETVSQLVKQRCAVCRWCQRNARDLRQYETRTHAEYKRSIEPTTIPTTVAGWTTIAQKGLVPAHPRLHRADSLLGSGMSRQEEIISGNAIWGC